MIGGALPAAIAADWLTSAWDQNNGLYVCAPAASVVEEVAGRWVKELLGLPAQASFAFVTGCQMAHATALVAARHQVLERAGHDVEHDGLAGAPQIRVIAGEVNTGAFDEIAAVADLASRHGAWHHVDGAFGLWAAASPALRHLTRGVDRADSWPTDAHKWLNVPYDSGIAFCAHPEAHQAALGIRSSYLVFADDARDALDWTPEHSRRARTFPVYAAIRSLGREGVAAIIEDNCARARQLAEGLAGEDDEATDAAVAAVQASGEAWLGGTSWDGRRAIRVSVSNWQTSEDDVERTIAAFSAARSATAANTSR